MPKPKPLSKELIVGAMSQTLSNRAAARYLNCSYQHYKKWAKLYESKTHDNLFEQHKNQSGKGIPKFSERRVSDYKMPLLLNFKDNNKKNYRKENIELLCYNHYFLTVGDIFSDKQIKGIEDHVPVNQATVEWEMDDYTRQRLVELGLDKPEEEYGSDLISKI